MIHLHKWCKPYKKFSNSIRYYKRCTKCGKEKYTTGTELENLFPNWRTVKTKT